MRYFSFQEAQARIPELERIFKLCAEVRGKAQARLECLRRIQDSPCPDLAEMAIEKSQVEFLAQCVEQALRQVEAMGALLKGVEPGLVDFPHQLDDGTEVYLCWREGEKRIRHYHGVAEGFSGRRPLPNGYLPH